MLQLQHPGTESSNVPPKHPTNAPPARGLRSLRSLIAGATLLSSVGSILAQTATRGPLTAEEKQQGYSNRTFLAKPLSQVGEADVVAAEARDGFRLHRRLGDKGQLRVMEMGTGETVVEAIAGLRATGRYEFVEPDYVVKVHATPNDPRFLSADQWALRNIGQNNGTAGADVSAEAAWEIRSAAAEVVVAIIDSGVARTRISWRISG